MPRGFLVKRRKVAHDVCIDLPTENNSSQGNSSLLNEHCGDGYRWNRYNEEELRTTGSEHDHFEHPVLDHHPSSDTYESRSNVCGTNSVVVGLLPNGANIPYASPDSGYCHISPSESVSSESAQQASGLLRRIAVEQVIKSEATDQRRDLRMDLRGGVVAAGDIPLRSYLQSIDPKQLMVFDLMLHHRAKLMSSAAADAAKHVTDNNAEIQAAASAGLYHHHHQQQQQQLLGRSVVLNRLAPFCLTAFNQLALSSLLGVRQFPTAAGLQYADRLALGAAVATRNTTLNPAGSSERVGLFSPAGASDYAKSRPSAQQGLKALKSNPCIADGGAFSARKRRLNETGSSSEVKSVCSEMTVPPSTAQQPGTKKNKKTSKSVRNVDLERRKGWRPPVSGETYDFIRTSTSCDNVIDALKNSIRVCTGNYIKL